MGKITPVELGYEPAEPTHVFTGRDGTRYTVPNPVPAALMLEAVERVGRDGEAKSTPWLLRELFGEEGVAELKRSASTEQLNKVMDIAVELVLGDQEGN